MMNYERQVSRTSGTIYDLGIIFETNVRINFGFLIDVFLPKAGVIFNA